MADTLTPKGAPSSIENQAGKNQAGNNQAGIAAAVELGLRKRYAKEARFKFYGIAAIGFALGMLGLLFFTIISNGYTAFLQTKVNFDIPLEQADIDPEGTADPAVLGKANYRSIVFNAMRAEFPTVSGRSNRRALTGLLSSGADFELREIVLDEPAVIGTTQSVWLTLSDDADVFVKGRSTDIELEDGRGIASLVEAGDRVKILSTVNDFSDALGEAKDVLTELALRTDRDARQRRAAEASYVAQLAQATSDEERAQFEGLIATAVAEAETLEAKAADLRARASNPGGEEPVDTTMPSTFVVMNGGVIKATKIANSEIEGEILVPLAASDGTPTEVPAGTWQILTFETPEGSRRISDKQAVWLWVMQQRGKVEKKFNTTLFTAGDSREPEQAGIWGAVMGSFFTLIVTLTLSFPIGVMAAVYLEEFAPKNRWTDLIEVNINNLAAVPSIVFGLLGLAMFLNIFGMPRSAPLVGGMVLTLMTLPTIIIASRAALKSVPPSIREAALGMGASRLQAMTHHVLPLALPGMLTGTIIGMAQALGETAPLLMIGMVAFIVDIPGGFTDPATVLPVQIYLWADAPERAFVERTSAAIMVLLGFLILMNLTAVLLRKKFETRW